MNNYRHFVRWDSKSDSPPPGTADDRVSVLYGPGIETGVESRLTTMGRDYMYIGMEQPWCFA